MGLTALQLPSMDAVHWSARACFSSSMVFGVASVFTAVRQHQTVGMLNSPLHIRLWLSRGRPNYFQNISRGFFDTTSNNTDKYADVPAFQRLPLESSIFKISNHAILRNKAHDHCGSMGHNHDKLLSRRTTNEGLDTNSTYPWTTNSSISAPYHSLDTDQPVYGRPSLWTASCICCSGLFF